MRTRLSLTLIVPLLGGSLFAQSAPSTPAPNRQWLAGAWTLDKSGPPEDTKNWDRPLPTPKLPTPCVEGTVSRNPPNVYEPCGMPQLRGTDTELHRMHSLSCFGEKLMMGSDGLAISVEPDAITVDDDFREPTRYATSKTTTIRVVTGQPHAKIVPRCLVSSVKVSVKTSWNGGTLVQELWTRDLMEIVRITQTFTPFDEDRRMLLVIKVLEPKLKDPVKDIERVYVRQPS